MNKTISINIGGLIFQISEEAYQVLEKYLEDLKSHFSSNEGREEILQDIESRIAEIFQDKAASGRQVITLEDVNEAIGILGKPDDISGGTATSGTGGESAGRPPRKRLYRDEEHRVAGGVCAGLGHYFDVDPLWFRIGFIVALIFFGTSALIYLVLWIILPVAVTSEDKMNMKGAPVTITEIEANIRREFDEMKIRFRSMKDEDYRKKHRERFEEKLKRRRDCAYRHSTHRQRAMASGIAGQRPSPANSRERNGVGSIFGEIFYTLLKILLTLAGTALLVIAILLTLGLVLSLTAPDTVLFFTKWGISSVSIPAFAQLLFENHTQQQMAILCIILLIGIPFIMLIFNSIRLIAGYRHKVRIISGTAGFFWLCGLILLIILGVRVAGNFQEKANRKTDVQIPQTAQTILVDITDSSIPGAGPAAFDRDDECGKDSDHGTVFTNCFIVENQESTTIYGYPQLRITESKSGNFELSVVRMARGRNLLQAGSRAESIQFNTHVSDSTLRIDPWFVLKPGEKWRNQRVRIIIRVPEGKGIVISENMNRIVFDPDQLDGSWDPDMCGKRMVMHNGRLVPSENYIPDSVQKTPMKPVK